MLRTVDDRVLGRGSEGEFPFFPCAPFPPLRIAREIDKVFRTVLCLWWFYLLEAHENVEAAGKLRQAGGQMRKTPRALSHQSIEAETASRIRPTSGRRSERKRKPRASSGLIKRCSNKGLFFAETPGACAVFIRRRHLRQRLLPTK